MNPTPPEDERTVMPERAAVPKPRQAEMGHNALPVGTKLGEFEITGLIGEGGFGIVYLAHDHSLQRDVAVKEYMPSELAARPGGTTVAVKSARHAETFQAGLRSFINEARLLAQFDHPSLVKVYRFWEANGTAYMVMPYYEGVTLKEALRRLGGPPDEAWLKDLLRPLLDALALIHKEQCYHRDIAPDNILVLRDGRPLLLDFGAARRVISDMTHALTVILKPGYAPVEQYAEVPSMKQGPWTDIYALAAVMYFAIAGKPPLPSVARMMSDSLEPASRIAAGRYSEDFLRGIDKALAVKPEDRPQDIAELRAVLGLGERRQRERTSLPGAAPAAALPSARPVEPTGRPQQGGKRPIVAYAVAAGLVLALAIGAGFWLNTQEPAPPPTVAQQPPAPPSVPAPVAEPAPAPPAEPFDPVRMLDEVFQGRDLGYAVTAAAEKARVRIDRDRLRFSIRSSRPGYVYVLMVGSNRSDFWLLFPNALDKNNRIEAGKPMDLPRPGEWKMVAAGPPGTDQFVAIVSENPRDFGAAGLRPMGPFAEFPLDAAERLHESYSGSTPLFAGRAVCPAKSAADCSEAYGAAVFSIEEFK